MDDGGIASRDHGTCSLRLEYIVLHFIIVFVLFLNSSISFETSRTMTIFSRDEVVFNAFDIYTTNDLLFKS